jgi:hypothetical protein
MDVATDMSRADAFLIRYRPIAARDEFRNVAVALITEGGEFASVRHLPPSQVTGKLRERGLLDTALVGIGRLIADNPTAALHRMRGMQGRLSGSVLIDGPMPTDVAGDPPGALSSLYRALVAVKSVRSPGTTRGALLDRSVAALRDKGAKVRIGEYFHDYLVDALISPADKAAVILHAQSFDIVRKDWTRAEYETAHFLWAAEKTRTEALCVVQPPVLTDDRAAVSHARVTRWLADAGVTVVGPSDLSQLASRFGPTEQLALSMAI